MSRNARKQLRWFFLWCWTLGGGGILAGLSHAASPADLLFEDDNKPRARVVAVYDAHATVAYEAQAQTIRTMVQRGITNLTGTANLAAAWRSLVSTQDVVGIKIISAPGPNGGTRPAVIAAVIEGLLEAQVPPKNIVVWDKSLADLRRGGYLQLAKTYGIRVEGSMASGFDEKTFYQPDTPIVGPLDPDDHDFGKADEGSGRRSYVYRLVAKQITKHISIAPLLNHSTAGTSGHLYSLALSSVDNTRRFEMDPARLAQAVPEIFALPAISDRLALCVTDALLCQYLGQKEAMLHYSTVLNELRFSKDPVALDVLSVRDLHRERRLAKANLPFVNQDLFQNASLLDLGVSELKKIMLERFH